MTDRLEAHHVVAAFAHVVANDSADVSAIQDTSRLPFPKQMILDAFFTELSIERNEERIAAMETTALALSQFQDGVGPAPLYPLGISFSSVSALRGDADALARKIVKDDANRERYAEFKGQVEKDKQEIISAIERARKARKAGSEGRTGPPVTAPQPRKSPTKLQRRISDKTWNLAVEIAFVLIGLCILLALSFGCARFPDRPTWQPEPVFRGVAQELPSKETRLLVYHTDRYPVGVEMTISEHEAIMWLQEHGYTVIERSQIDRVIAEQKFTMKVGDDSTVLRAGRILGAQQIIFLTAGYDRITLRATDAETGRILWSGLGYYPDRLYFTGGEHVSPLVRKTLAAVWASQGNSR